MEENGQWRAEVASLQELVAKLLAELGGFASRGEAADGTVSHARGTAAFVKPCWEIQMGLLDFFSGKPNEKSFAKLVMKTLRSVGDTRAATFDAGEFRIVFSQDGKEMGVLNLRNLFIEYCNATPKDRNALLKRTCVDLARMVEVPDDFEDVVPDLYPSIRSRSMLEVMQLDAEIAGMDWHGFGHWTLSEHLVACLVYDLPNSVQFISQEMLEKWGVSVYEAGEIAKQNLAQRPFSIATIGDNFFIFMGGDSYDATRMLLLDAVRSLDVKGATIAMPVNRDTLLLTGEDDERGLGIMADLAEEKRDESRPICPIAHKLVDDDWEPWLPPAEHPHHEKFRVLAMRAYFSQYDEQKKLMEKLHEKTERDVFVASYSIVERDHRTMTYAVWSKSVSTWLPETEYVGLFDTETEKTCFVPWDRLKSVVGPLMTKFDCYPARWSVEDFPSPQQIEQMRTESW